MSDEGRPRHEARAAEPGCTAPRGAPPSAAGDFEPYSARVRLRPTTQELETEPFLQALLEDVAASCVGRRVPRSSVI